MSDSGTGSEEVIDMAVPEINAENIIAVLKEIETEQTGEEPFDFEAVSFVQHGNKYAFILKAHDAVHFGDILFVGIVYTDFI